jgi:copper chaperone CopZ
MSGEEPDLPSPLPTLFAVILAASPLAAELLHVEQPVGGLDCASCAQSVDKTLKKIKGVETASFRTADAVAVLEMKPGNTVPLDEIRDAVKRIGYTPKEAKVTVRGEARMEGGHWLFRVTGGAVEYPLDVSAGQGIADQLRQCAGGIAIVEGSIAAERGAPLKVSSARRVE